MVTSPNSGGSTQRSRIPFWNALKAASPGMTVVASAAVSTKCTKVLSSSRSERSRTPCGAVTFNSANTAAISSAFLPASSGLVLYLIKVRFMIRSLWVQRCSIIAAQPNRRSGLAERFSRKENILDGVPLDNAQPSALHIARFARFEPHPALGPQRHQDYLLIECMGDRRRH